MAVAEDRTFEFFCSPLVTVIAARDDKRFYIHEDILVKHSGFFKARLSKNWVSGEQEEVKLDDVKATDFKYVVAWMYNDPKALLHLSNPKDRWRPRYDVMPLYAIADILVMPLLKNALLETLRIQLLDQRVAPSAPVLCCAHKLSLAHTHLYKFFLASFTYSSDTYPTCYPSGDAKWTNIYTQPEIALDFVREYKTLKDTKYGDPRKKRDCKWHDHSDGSSCEGNEFKEPPAKKLKLSVKGDRVGGSDSEELSADSQQRSHKRPPYTLP